MTCVISRCVRDGESVGIGVNSPIPTAACLLARRLHAPNVSLRTDVGGEGVAFIGSKEFFDFAQRGKLDLFFLSGVQIDRRGRINMHVLGDYGQPRRRFPGAFGSAVLYPVVKRVILFRTEHSPRVLVPEVDFVTADAGAKGPDRVVTPMAVLTFDRDRGELELASYHPGQSVDSVRAATGFELRVRDDVHQTPAAGEQELAVLRGEVYAAMKGAYPRYVAGIAG